MAVPVLGIASALPAAAQFATPAAEGYVNLLGDNTAAAETGIYEFRAAVLIAMGVGIGLVLLYAGWKQLRKAGNKV